MDGSINGSGHDLRTGRFKPGNSEYRARRKYVAHLFNAIVTDLGGKKAKLTQLEQALAQEAAEQLAKARRVRDQAIRTRCTSSATKLIDRVREGVEQRKAGAKRSTVVQGLSL